MANSHSGKVLRGVGLSPGIAIGRVYFIDTDISSTAQRTIGPDEVEVEIGRFRSATAETRKQLQAVKGKLERAAAIQEARIFQVHLLILEDPAFAQEVEALIRNERINAEAAVARVAKSFEDQLLGLNDPLHRDRAFDIRDVSHRMLQVLLEREQQALWTSTDPFVVCARELLPSMAVSLEKDKLLGMITEVGGTYSHAAILARTFGIPAVSGIEGISEHALPGSRVVVDGTFGRVIIEPTADQVAAEEEKRHEYRRLTLTRPRLDTGPAVTKDGCTLELCINVENFDSLKPEELAAVSGIGLYRTEFLFMDRDTFPSEEEQLAFYRSVLAKADGRTVTFRTIDIGGDKPLKYLKMPKEDNPALGWRGVRISFEWPDMFYAQLRALIRAACHGPMRILLPMVTALEEVFRAKMIIANLAADLRAEGVPVPQPIHLGVMIEVPSAALIADEMAREVDFLSIGTNDLVQYVMAVDRNNLRVAQLYQPCNPAMVYLLERVIAAGKKHGRDVSVCGEMAGRPESALLLLGLGLRQFSMAPPSVASVKGLLRLVSIAEAESIAAHVRQLRTAPEIETFLAAESSRLAS